MSVAEHKKQKSGDSAGQDGPRAKEARKERKVLEKKMALSRRRKLDSRCVILQNKFMQHLLITVRYLDIFACAPF